MAAVVIREALKQCLRNSSKLMGCFHGGECVFAPDRCSRRVFSSCWLLDRTGQGNICRRSQSQNRRHHLGVLRVCVAGHHGSECITHQDCWKCGSAIDPNKEQYFCECGVVQPPIEKRSLFQVMGLDEKFDIDLRLLAEKYRDLQRILHPDKYSQKSEMERDFSIQHSSLVNKAYNTLLKPLSRGLYMLRLTEEDLEKESQMNIEFLDRIMEINESIIEADSLETIDTLLDENQRVLDSLIADISKAFRSDDRVLAKKLLLQLKYYVNIDEKIKAFKIKYSE